MTSEVTGAKNGIMIEPSVSFTSCFEAGFTKDIVPFGIHHFGSCTWLIISTALQIFFKQTCLAHIHPPFKICLLSLFQGLEEISDGLSLGQRAGSKCRLYAKNVTCPQVSCTQIKAKDIAAFGV